MVTGVSTLYRSTAQSLARFASLEMFVRPFVSVDSTPKLREITAPEEVLPEATIEWGAASEFGTGDSFREQAGSPGFIAKEHEKPVRVRLGYSEEARGWKDYRVENPNDPDQYAIVRACTAVSMRGPNGEQAFFDLSSANSLPNQQEGDGQTPPTPPMNEIE